MDGGFEGIETFVIPCGKRFKVAAGEMRHVNVDGAGLADAVQATDALFKQFDIVREIQEDKMVGELEVSAFTADFRADEQAHSFGVGKGGRMTVALEQGETFVEEFAVNIDLLLNALTNEGSHVCSVADGEHFFSVAKVL